MIPGLSPITQPIRAATSPTIAVTIPMKVRAAKKHGTPFQMWGGGQKAKSTFHPTERKWRRASPGVTSVISPSSLFYGWSMIASII